MFQIVRNLIIAVLAISVFATGCGNNKKNKTRLPMRNNSGSPTDDKTKTKVTDDGKDGEDDDTFDVDADLKKRQEEYEAAKNGLEKDMSEISVKDLAAGKYELINVSTEFILTETSFGVLAVNDFSGSSRDGHTYVKGSTDDIEGATDDKPTALNIARSFTLATKDGKLEVTNKEMMKLVSRAKLDDVRAIESKDDFTFNAPNGLSNLDVIVHSVDKFSETLGKEASVKLLKSGDDKVLMVIEIKLSTQEMRVLFVTYKVKAASTEAAPEAGSDTDSVIN